MKKDVGVSHLIKKPQADFMVPVPDKDSMHDLDGVKRTWGTEARLVREKWRDPRVA